MESSSKRLITSLWSPVVKKSQLIFLNQQFHIFGKGFVAQGAWRLERSLNIFSMIKSKTFCEKQEEGTKVSYGREIGVDKKGNYPQKYNTLKQTSPESTLIKVRISTICPKTCKLLSLNYAWGLIKLPQFLKTFASTKTLWNIKKVRILIMKHGKQKQAPDNSKV